MKRIKYITGALAVIVILASIYTMPSRAASISAEPYDSSIYIDGKPMFFTAYNIEGSGYFRLCDLAYALRGTDKQFEIKHDYMENQIRLIPGKAYTPVSGEIPIFYTPDRMTATLATSYHAFLDGVKLNLTAYTVGVYTYVRLRDLAAALNFGVSYLAEQRAVAIDTAARYIPPLSELRVTMIGDSVGVGVDPYLKKLLPRLDNDSKTCRQFYHAPDIVRQKLEDNTLAQTVVIELGTNGTIRESDMRTLIELLGSERKIVFVNCQLPKAWGVTDNMLIAKVTADYPNTAIADWYGASLNRDDYFYSDHVHPTAKGARVLAQVIADAVEKIQ